MIHQDHYQIENEQAANTPHTEELAAHYKEILNLLGEEPEREGLQKTPMRVAKAMQVLTRGYKTTRRWSS